MSAVKTARTYNESWGDTPGSAATVAVASDQTTPLELDDIQSGVLRPRPTPYAATYIAFRIDDRNAGRDLMRRVSEVVTSAAHPNSPLADTSVSVALTYQGLKGARRSAGIA
jgi:deferrochelatase/peroxidase EfeB